MTEQPDPTDDSPLQAGDSTDVEITPQMIEAGAAALYDCLDGLEDGGLKTTEAVERVLQAALRRS